MDPTKRIGRWKPDEDAWLLASIQRYGHSNWAFIQSFVPHRTDVQCRERYMNVLNPDLSHERFTLSEDERLKAAVEEYGEGKWSHIASLFPNRTDNQCRRRWLILKRDKKKIKKAPRRSNKH